MSGGQGEKKGEAEGGESKGEGGEDPTLIFFCTGFSRRFPNFTSARFSAPKPTGSSVHRLSRKQD